MIFYIETETVYGYRKEVRFQDLERVLERVICHSKGTISGPNWG